MAQSKTNQEELDYYQNIREHVLQIMQEHGFDNNPKAFADHIGVEYLTVYNFVSSRSSRPKLFMLKKILEAFPEQDLTWFFAVPGYESAFKAYKPLSKKAPLSVEELLLRNTKADNMILKLMKENSELKDKLIESNQFYQRITAAFTQAGPNKKR